MKCPILSYIKRSDRMDKYTKSILTVIAVGIIALNIQLFDNDKISNISFLTKANATITEYSWKDLTKNNEFVKAVEWIVESCETSGSEIEC